MNRRTVILLGSFAVAVFAQSATAQMSAAPSKSSATAKKPVRTASIPKSPPAEPIVVNTTGLPIANTTGAPTSSTSGAPAAVAQITYYPTVVLTDGRVLANFGTGRGYEQVLVKCPQISGVLPPGAVMAPCWIVDAGGRYVVLQQR